MKTVFKLVVLSFKKSSGWFWAVAGAAGTIADVLQPIAPITSYLFFLSAFVCVGSLVVIILNQSLGVKLVPAFVFFSILAIICGVITTFQSNNEKGILASNITQVSSLQASMGLMAEGVSSIRDSTDRIDKNTSEIARNTKKAAEATQKTAETINDSTRQIVRSLSEMGKGFSALTRLGGLVADPTLSEQFYHNARVYELNGDYGNARRSYVKYFSFKLEFLDPHLRYQTFLKIQEGLAGAREIYSEMYENDKRPIVEFAKIVLFNSPLRTQMLEELVSRQPNFGFAYLELSKEFSELRTGVSTVKNMVKEYDYLIKFIDSYDNGDIAKLFIDKERLAEIISKASQRIKFLKRKSGRLENPVSVSVYPEVRSEHVRDMGSRDKTTILKTIWNISLKVIESAKEPKIVLTQGQSQQPIQIKSQSSSGEHSEFHFLINDDDFGREIALSVTYTNALGDFSGPYKLSLNKEKYVISFFEGLATMDVDLGVAVSEDSVALAGFPFAHKFSSFEAKKTYLYWVAETNYVEAAKWLLNNGVAIAPNGYHRTSPLIVSIENGHLGMVRLLAENGADVNGGRVGPCPLELAMGIKETQLKQRMVELLEGYGAKYYASSSRHC